ncbi:MAG: DUF4433 domain-containing protein [Thermoleophilia bacterium]
MTLPPQWPKIYHITHVDNLRQILADGGLFSDAKIAQARTLLQPIGMSRIKHRRLHLLNVHCHPGTKVGDYVPFYFCPRSVMLYVIHCANHPELTYRGGQDPIIHLEADLHTVIKWANENHVRWAFSLGNAGAYHAEFYSDLQDLDKLNWDAIAATDFRDPDIKEGKQAEFLVYEFFPFELVERIGVRMNAVGAQVLQVLRNSSYSPRVEVLPRWYF